MEAEDVGHVVIWWKMQHSKDMKTIGDRAGIHLGRGRARVNEPSADNDCRQWHALLQVMFHNLLYSM
jgi:hypothetical protein